MITVQFSTSGSLGARAIRWWTWSDWSHIDFVLPDGRLLGARSDGGVQSRPADYAPFTQTLRLATPGPMEIYNRAQSQIGKPHDRGAIFGLGLRHDWQDPSQWFCSELVAWAFLRAGWPLLRTRTPGRITPRDIVLSPLWSET